MAPKKKSKKSKAELEAERVEAERLEALALAEREKRAEEERVALEARLAALREERKAARESEWQTLQAEKDEWVDVEVSAEEDEAESWSKTLRCSRLPDAAVDAEVNTFLSEIEADGFEGTLKTVAKCQKLGVDLADLELEAVARRDERDVERAKELLRRLRARVTVLLERAAAHVLQNAKASKQEVMVTGTDVDGMIKDPEMPPRTSMRAPSTPVMVKEPVLVRCAQETSDDEAEPTEERGKVRVGVWANLAQKSIRGPFKQLHFPQLGLHLDLPKSLGTQRVAARVVAVPYDFVPSPYSRDGGSTSQFLILGGVVQVELLDVPPAPVEIKPRLQIQKMTELATSVRVQHFPPGADLTSVVPLDAPVAPALNQYLRVRITVSESVLLPEEPNVAWWDPARRDWILGTTSNVERTKREVGFSATRSGILALVQPRTLDLPFQSWALEAHCGEASDIEKACSRLTLDTPRMRLVIQIDCDGLCSLVEPTTLLLPQHISPAKLVRRLRQAGVHVAAESPHDDKASRSVKTDLLEAKLAVELAALAASFDFRSAPTALDDARRVAVLARETHVYVGNNPEDTFEFMTLLVEHDVASTTKTNAPDVPPDDPTLLKCSVVKANDVTQQLAPSHLAIRRCVAPGSSPEAMARVDRAPVRFQAAITHLLRLTRPFSFT